MDDQNNSLTLLENGKTTDIAPTELKLLEDFKEAGLPGITSLGDVFMAKSLDLYLSGKTYHEIAKTLSTKKEIVLYLAQKFDWYNTKIQQLEILDAGLKERILHAKLTNQDFLLQIQQFYLTKIGRHMTRYMATGDEDIARKVSEKDIDRLYKAIDLLDRLTTEKVNIRERGPTIGLNLGDGVNIQKIGENEVSITPKQRTVGEMLEYYANLKRAEETSTEKVLHDITVETVKTEREKK